MLNWSTCEPSWLSTCTTKDHAVHINMAQKCHQPLTHLRNGDGLALSKVYSGHTGWRRKRGSQDRACTGTPSTQHLLNTLVGARLAAIALWM